MASHSLEIETDRGTRPNKTPLENRKCKQCNILEDEFHFMLECVLYKKKKKKKNYGKSTLINITGKRQI